jgi:NAD(P)-dependent dehydrogenase (short-subunit alcohol dehydrogenase family)
MIMRVFESWDVRERKRGGRMDGLAKRYMITGAASGIGAATGRRLAGTGVGLVLHTRRNQAGLDGLAEAARSAGATVVTVLGDLADPGTADALGEAACRAFGGIDVLIANAGFADRTPVAALSDDALRTSVEVIQAAFLRLVRALLPALRAARDGRVIAVSSFVAHTFRTDVTAFPASAVAKAGLEALVRALAVELGPVGVTVNAVVPGFVEKDAGAHRAVDPTVLAAQTARIPLGRIGRPDDIAAAIAFLASPAASYITGQALHVDGGLVIHP